MAFIDFIQDNARKFIPQKKQPGIPMPISTSTGGIGHGVASFEDEMPLSKPAIVFYALQIFFSFLAMCCFASVASFQSSNHIGVSFLSGLAIFISLTGLLLSAMMLLVPVIYDKYDKLAYLSRAIREDRVHFILSTFGILWLLLISFVTTISAWTEPGCKDSSNDPHASLGKSFQSALEGWCQTKKAGAIFFWLAFISWGATFAIIVKEWRTGKVRGRPRDPPFTNPVEHSREDSDTSSYYPQRTTQVGNRRPLTDVDEDEEPPQSPFADPPISPVSRYNNGVTPSLPPVQVLPRQSMDTYGAFSDPAPSGYNDPPPEPEGVSRTMQYADPYAVVRANIGPRVGPPEAQPPRYE